MTTFNALAARDGKLCRYCGSTKRLTIEHLRPKTRGGTDRMGNLGISCYACNTAKGPLNEREFLMLRHMPSRLAAKVTEMNKLLLARSQVELRIRRFKP